ncbi:glutamic acid-rich protein isoform X1 [Prunus yedoensis var. nudiflora]|uniref:Glutamic acid-rich protein isoform X1 n=1 Tax=Prunus yedoensis var. nudiflora TaxID=2094558 RepID=A0A314ZD73_PRUYE|nr:glutamic acid-rich protein isoform X1 [Prunus yedoensis var. nudiflora]
MATEALEDKKPEDEAPLEEKQEAEAEVEPKEDQEEQEKEEEKEEEKENVPEASEKVTENEEEQVGEEAEEEKEKESEETPKKAKRGRKTSSKKEEKDKTEPKKRGRDSSGKKSSKEAEAEKKEKEPVTPVSERPTRERKIVERYSAPESGRASANKALSIEKGRGTELKNIPNVAFKLSKRKIDDNLQLLHTILFGKKAKAHNLKKNISQFSGYVWTENEQEKQRTRVKEKLDKCVKEKLVDFCEFLNIPIKAGTKKEELSVKLLEFLESPHVTTDVLLAEKEQKGQKRRRKVTPSKIAGSGDASPETSAKESSKAEEEEGDDNDETSDAKDNSVGDDDHNTMDEDTDHEE